MVPAAEVRNRMEFFRKRCAECGLAGTHQRQVLYKALAESDEHLSPEALYAKVKSEIPAISLGTVYRNMKIFKDCGLLKEVTPLHEASRLDPNLTDHHHLVCRFCHWIFDLTDEAVEPLRFRGDLPRKFQVERYDILGICSQCAETEKTNRAVTALTKPRKEKKHGKSSQANGGTSGHRR